METLRQDLRFALRSLRNARATTVIAVLCLALGIGANTAIFSVVRAVLLQSLPYGEPERLVRINETGSRGIASVSAPVYFDMKAQRQIFEDVAAFAIASADLGDAGEPERLRGVRGTVSLFTTLGVKPMIGRGFLASDEPPSGSPAVVISEGLWRRRFAADPRLVGAKITLNNTRYTVIGVMPRAFDFPMSTTRKEFWIPLDFARAGGITNRNNRSFQVVARLAPGLDSAAAAARLSIVARQLSEAYPEAHKNRGLLVRGLNGTVVGGIRLALLVLLGAVGLVLLIACANVANLTLARAAARRREVAIRTALGADRSRLVRQLLTESALLAMVGGALGLAIAWWGLHTLLGASANVLPRSDSIGIQGGVLVFAVAISLGTGLAVGLIPALRASQSDLREDLSDAAGRSSASAARHRTLKSLIAAEIALSVVLLTGAGLVIRSVAALLEVDAGFRAEGVLTFTTAAPEGRIADTLRYSQFYGPVLDRLRALPRVRAAGMTSMLPVQGGTTDRFFHIVGRPDETDINRRPDAELRIVSSQYFRALGIRILNGREFTDQDTPRTEPVAIVNDELVRRYFPGENPIGQRLEGFGPTPVTIVGVVRSVREIGLDRELLPEFYMPAPQMAYEMGDMAFVVSSVGDPEALAPQVREVVRGIAPQQPVYRLSTMSGVVRESLGSRRLLLMLLGLFAGLALVLSAAGVYGVMSYGVTQRQREIGIRIALGAKFGDVTGMVLRDVAVVAAIGIAAGVAAALAFSRVMTSVLYGVGVYDGVTFVAVPVLIAAVALLAGAVPAVRAARVDPLVAMRDS
jgi:predicted permease